MRIPNLSPAEGTQEVHAPESQPTAHANQELQERETTDHSEIGAAASAASQALDGNDDRISELRRQYLNGSYQPEPAKVAAKIVDEHLG